MLLFAFAAVTEQPEITVPFKIGFTYLDKHICGDKILKEAHKQKRHIVLLSKNCMDLIYLLTASTIWGSLLLSLLHVT